MAAPRVFISYSSDDTAIVKRIKDALTLADAVVWLDHEKLPPGTPNWEIKVREGITQATHVLYMASKSAATSDFVIDEVNIAKEERKNIIPFWVRGSDAHWRACIPLGFGSYQRIDGRGAAFDSGLAELLRTLGLTLPPPPASDAPTISRRALLIGAGGLVAAGATITILVKLNGHLLMSATTPTPTPPPVPGSLRWRYPTGNEVISSPTVANGVVYIGSLDNSVYALDAATGAKRWSFPTGNAVFSSPAVANGVVFVGSLDYSVYALDAATGAERWSFPTGSWVESTPTVANGVVYIGSDDNSVYALDAVTGAKHWSFQKVGLVPSSPAVASGVVYVGSGDGHLYALNA